MAQAAPGLVPPLDAIMHPKGLQSAEVELLHAYLTFNLTGAQEVAVSCGLWEHLEMTNFFPEEHHWVLL